MTSKYDSGHDAHTHIGSTHNRTHHPKAQALVDVHAGAFLIHAYCCTSWNTHSLLDMILCTPMRALAPAMSLLTYASTHACPHKNFSASCLSDFHYAKHCKALKAGVGARSVPPKTDIQFKASSMWGGFCIDPCCFYVQAIINKFYGALSLNLGPILSSRWKHYDNYKAKSIYDTACMLFGTGGSSTLKILKYYAYRKGTATIK